MKTSKKLARQRVTILVPYHDDSSYGEEKGIGCLPKMVVELMKPASKNSAPSFARALPMFSGAGRYGSAVHDAMVQQCRALWFSSAER